MLSWSTSNRGVPNPSTKRPPLCCLAMPLHSSLLLDCFLHRNEMKLRRHFFLYIHLRSGFEGQDEVEVKDTLPSLGIYQPDFRYILFRYMVTSCCFCESDPPSWYCQVRIGLKTPSSFLYLSTPKQVALQLLNAVLPSVRKTCCCLLLQHSENWKSSSDPLGILLFQ